MSGDQDTWHWGCSRCKGAEYAEQDSKRGVRNCDDERNANLAWSWAPSLRRCPWSQIDRIAWQLIEVWADWKRFGTTAWGDIMTAPNPIVEAIRLIESVRDEFGAKHDADYERLLAKARGGANG